MEINPWGDDNSWWHQQDLEMQERDEEERINACDRALAELNAIINEELQKVTWGRQLANCLRLTSTTTLRKKAVCLICRGHGHGPRC